MNTNKLIELQTQINDLDKEIAAIKDDYKVYTLLEIKAYKSIEMLNIIRNKMRKDTYDSIEKFHPNGVSKQIAYKEWKQDYEEVVNQLEEIKENHLKQLENWFNATDYNEWINQQDE